MRPRKRSPQADDFFARRRMDAQLKRKIAGHWLSTNSENFRSNLERLARDNFLRADAQHHPLDRLPG